MTHQPACTYPHPQYGVRRATCAYAYRSSTRLSSVAISLRDPATLGYKKMDAANNLPGNFPVLWQNRQAARDVWRKGGEISGCSVTRPTSVTRRCGGNSIRNARTGLATTSTSSVNAKGEPTQMRGPAPNGM